MSINKQPVISIALITAVCVMGDAMLYIVLPLYWPDFGLNAVWQVGVLLAVNRMIRLPLNPIIGWLYRHINKRTGVFLAVGLTVLTTFSYGLLQSFWWLVLMRCLWGVAWSFLRLGGYLLVLDQATDATRGHLIGTYNGLWGLGGLVGMLGGGVLADTIGIQTMTTVFSLMAFFSLPFVWIFIPATISREQTTAQSRRSVHVLWKNKYVRMVLLSGLIVGMITFGIFASTLSLIIEFQLSDVIWVFGVGIGAATLAGMIQAIRWGWDPFLAPFVGHLTDVHVGRKPVLIIALFGGSISFAFLIIDHSLYILLVVLLLFQVMSTMMMTTMDALASDTATRTLKVTMMTAYTVVVDVGAALGPFIGYLIMEWRDINTLYIGTSFLMFVMAVCWTMVWYRKEVRQ